MSRSLSELRWRRQRASSGSRPGCWSRIQTQPVRLQAVDQHVQVADRAQAIRQDPQPTPKLPGLARFEGIVEDSPGGAQPPSGHAHVVEILQVGAIARAALLRPHTSEVVLDDLARGLGQAVIRKDPDGPRAVRANDRNTLQLRRGRGVGRRRFRGGFDGRGGLFINHPGLGPGAPSAAAQQRRRRLEPVLVDLLRHRRERLADGADRPFQLGA